jgi:cytochrome c2
MLRNFSKSKRMIGLWLALLALVVPLLVQAGGWAVLSLQSWPEEVVAERPFTIQFVVRQHGNYLMGGLSPVVTAVNQSSGGRLTFDAVAAAEDGYYHAEMTLPQSGAWEWQINAFGYDHVMPPLQVGAAESAAADESVRLSAVPFTIGIVSLVVAIVALFAWWQQRSRLRLAFAAVGIVVAAVALTVPWGSETAVAEQTNQAAVASAEMGEVLFVAKGCNTCHQHDGVTYARNFANIGPNLSQYVGNPDYLQSWLKDPAALKPQTLMPNLALNEEEIQILAAFLSQKEVGSDS